MQIEHSRSCCGLAELMLVGRGSAADILQRIRQTYGGRWRERPGVIVATSNNSQTETTDRELTKAGFVKVWEGRNPRYHEGYAYMGYADHRLKLWILDLNSLKEKE